MTGHRCHRAWDPDLRMWLHIPMCWGAAIGGPDQCTCAFPGSDLERARAEIEEWKAEAHLERQRRAKANQRAAQAEERRTAMWHELNRLKRSTAAPARPPGERAMSGRHHGHSFRRGGAVTGAGSGAEGGGRSRC